ncbi:lipocalin family protein [Aquimarina sp. 2201CG5-10]|uniref:lipocalin family protein n=1 Tax=Aquimarina callyspongiae TaxID=3098150 RepID=UPI002AB352FF|nr:lipocalin family protein [Aquimarina sp. 2201CG5-10]MDY8135798.1 hypothetical protein [Aquimarina sp. 2201CG5-10]
MKNYVYLFLLFSLLISCNDDDSLDNTSLIGKWNLKEQLVDPGDGSGTFQSVDSDMIIEFFVNGTITSSNGTLCNFTHPSTDSSSGTYSFSDKTILINCGENEIRIGFEQIGSELILHFLCIEECSQKYRKTLFP